MKFPKVMLIPCVGRPHVRNVMSTDEGCVDKFEEAWECDIMWVDVGELFDVNDDRFVVGIRELVANGIEVRIESVGNRIPGEVAIYVRSCKRGCPEDYGKGIFM